MDDATTVCIANIGPRERQKRLFFGIGSTIVGVAAAGALAAGGAATGWRLAAFVPLLGGALGIFQWREKT